MQEAVCNDGAATRRLMRWVPDWVPPGSSPGSTHPGKGRGLRARTTPLFPGTQERSGWVSGTQRISCRLSGAAPSYAPHRSPIRSLIDPRVRDGLRETADFLAKPVARLAPEDAPDGDAGAGALQPETE